MRIIGIVGLSLLIQGCAEELSPPTAPVISVAPSPAGTADDLTLSIDEESTDVDGDAITYRTAWYRDDALVDDQTDDTLPASATAKGQLWYAVVTPSSAGEDGPPGESDTVAIGDTPPSAPVVSVAAANTEDDLVATLDTPSVDPDDDDIDYEISWSRDGTVDPTHTTETVPSAATTQGEQWEVTYTPVADGARGPSASATTVIGDTPPTAPTVSLVASVTTTEDITVVLDVPSTDVDGDTVTYSYAWFLDEVLDATQTGDTLPASATTKGQSWRVVVTPSANGADGEPGTSGDTQVIDTAPTSPTVSIAATAQTGDDVPLSIDVESTDADEDAITYAIAWFNGDAQVAAYDDLTTLPAAATAKGQTWTVQLTPLGDGVAGTAGVSAPLTILDTPPSPPSISIVSSADTLTDIALSIDTESLDPDEDAVTYAIAWFNGDTQVAAYDDLTTLPAAATTKGQTWTVQVTPIADSVSGQPGTSDAVTIIDTPPTAPVVSLGPDPAKADEPLTASIDVPGDDSDDDDVSYTYAWFVNGTQRSSITGDTVDSSETSVGERWSVTVTSVADGVSGASAASNDVPIAALNGYFVRTAAGYGADLGSLSGADAVCLQEVNSADWLGKGDAERDGLLDADHVQAFLCNVGQCQGPLPDTDYQFAQVGSSSIGGAFFTTDSSGRGPGDQVAWDGPAHFGSAAEHWTGRGQGQSVQLWPMTGDVLNCFNWQVATSELWGGARNGRSNSTNTSRWGSSEFRCTDALRLLCVVQPVPVTPSRSACIAPWGEEIADGESVEAWDTSIGCEEACVSETRTCDDGVLSGSFDQATCVEPPTSDCENPGYFVVTSNTFSADLGGFDGANAECFAEVSEQDWRGKDTAGVLNPGRVEAFLCGDATCQNPEPEQIYQFARAGRPEFGGVAFLTDTLGSGPGEVAFWDGSDRFGFSSTWWSGRLGGEESAWWPTEGSGRSTCENWTTTSGFGTRGGFNRGGPATGFTRWDLGGGAGCATEYALLCMVHPEQ